MNSEIKSIIANTGTVSNDRVRPLTVSDISNEILSRQGTFNHQYRDKNVHNQKVKRETIQEYGFQHDDMDSRPEFDPYLVDLSDKDETETITKEYIYNQFIDLLNENRYLRNELNSVCNYIEPSSQHMYCDTNTVNRVTNMLDRWVEFEIVPRDISRVTLTRGSNAIMDDNFDDWERDSLFTRMNTKEYEKKDYDEDDDYGYYDDDDKNDEYDHEAEHDHETVEEYFTQCMWG